METVKVDIQKLQLLNDRIVQTIEALNQLLTDLAGPDGGVGAARKQGQEVVGAPRLHVAVRLDRLHGDSRTRLQEKREPLTSGFSR